MNEFYPHFSNSIHKAANAGQPMTDLIKLISKKVIDDPEFERLQQQQHQLLNELRQVDDKTIRDQIALSMEKQVERICVMWGINERPEVIFYNNPDSRVAAREDGKNGRYIRFNSAYWTDSSINEEEFLVAALHGLAHIAIERGLAYVPLIKQNTPMAISYELLGQEYPSEKKRADALAKLRQSGRQITDYEYYKTIPTEKVAFAASDLLKENLPAILAAARSNVIVPDGSPPQSYPTGTTISGLQAR